MAPKSMRPQGRRNTLLRLAVSLAPALLGRGAAAGKLAEPVGPVLLTLSGRVAQPNQGAQAVFDLAMLTALAQRRFNVKTPWEPRPVSFEGPLLREVLQAAEARGTRLTLVAVNDYKVEIPMDDLEHWDVVLALKMNGQAIPTRTKGPLFVVYPFDQAQGALLDQFRDRSIWQLVSIRID